MEQKRPNINGEISADMEGRKINREVWMVVERNEEQKPKQKKTRLPVLCPDVKKLE